MSKQERSQTIIPEEGVWDFGSFFIAPLRLQQSIFAPCELSAKTDPICGAWWLIGRLGAFRPEGRSQNPALVAT